MVHLWCGGEVQFVSPWKQNGNKQYKNVITWNTTAFEPNVNNDMCKTVQKYCPTDAEYMNGD